jgi:hypothetical protein
MSIALNHQLQDSPRPANDTVPDVWLAPIYYFSSLSAARAACNSLFFFASTVG